MTRDAVKKVKVDSLSAKQSVGWPKTLDLTKRATYNLLTSPADAAWILENLNDCNLRKEIVKTHVRFLTDIMARDEWEDNHPQGFIFDEKGKLADGQHRCYAMVSSGKSLWIKVETGCNESANKTYDSGKPRALKDHLSFSGDISLNKHIATIVRTFHSLSTGDCRKQPTGVYEQVYLDHATGIDFAASFVASRVKAVTRAGVGCALAEMFEYNKTKARLFADSLKVPDGTIQPARWLRDWCQKNSIGSGGGPRFWYDRAVYCMNAALQDRDVTQVRVGGWTVKPK